MTLTDREKKIVLIKYIIHGVSPFDKAPIDTRVRMLKSAVEKCGMLYDDMEMQSIGQECLDLQGGLNTGLMDFIKSNKDMVVKAHQELHKGNESLRKELGEDITKQSDDILKKPNWRDRFR
jgi:hypothetical protein